MPTWYKQVVRMSLQQEILDHSRLHVAISSLRTSQGVFSSHCPEGPAANHNVPGVVSPMPSVIHVSM